MFATRFPREIFRLVLTFTSLTLSSTAFLQSHSLLSLISSTSRLWLAQHVLGTSNMALLRNVVIFILAVSVITFIALFGQLPALRKTPIGYLQRLLCLHTPNTLKRFDQHISGGRLTEQSKIFGNYLFYEKNPIVLVSEAFHLLFIAHQSISDLLSHPAYWCSNIVHTECFSSASFFTLSTSISTSCSAIYLYISLCSTYKSLHNANESSETDAGLSIRSYLVSTEHDLSDM